MCHSLYCSNTLFATFSSALVKTLRGSKVCCPTYVMLEVFQKISYYISCYIEMKIIFMIHDMLLMVSQKNAILYAS